MTSLIHKCLSTFHLAQFVTDTLESTCLISVLVHLLSQSKEYQGVCVNIDCWSMERGEINTCEMILRQFVFSVMKSLERKL